MKKIQLVLLTLAASFAARADFSYTQTTKGSGSTAQVTRLMFKGSRMMSDTFAIANIVDFRTQTVTIINKSAKSYTVQKLTDLMETRGKATPAIEMKETGQKKTIGGYNCSEILMSMSADGMSPAGSATKVRVEMEFWISPDIPGWQSLHTFYKDNEMALAMMGARNSGVARAMAQMQQKLAGANGIPVLQVVRMKTSASEKKPVTPEVDQAIARLEDMARQPGAEGQMAQAALAKLKAASSGSSFETTMESSNFSTAAIPDSAFEVPAGFTKK